MAAENGKDGIPLIILLTGASHTGKTLLAQRLLERYGYPYLSLDLLKMGLIRSGNTALTPEDDRALEAYLWPIAREIVRTALENRQHLVVEGCYIPFSWQQDFSEAERREIRYRCLVMSRRYVLEHFSDIRRYANVIERRLDDTACTLEAVLADNAHFLDMCRRHSLPYTLIDDRYPSDLDV